MTKKFLLFVALFPSLLLAQYSIKGTFSPAEEFDFVILYKVTPTTSIYVKNTEIDNEGKFEFNLDSTNTKGTYRIVYAIPQEEYNFDIIYNKTEDVNFNFNFEEGISFTSSQENILLEAYSKSLQLNSDNINTYFASSNQTKDQFKSIFDLLDETQNEFEKASEGLIVSDFIKASKPYIPTDFETAELYSKNLKANYFKNIDFNNETLQSSSFLIETVLNYVFTFINSSDTINSYLSNIDDVVFAIGDNPIIKKTILKVLWKQFADIETESVANYIAENYLLELSTKDKTLSEILNVFKNTSINEIAPDFSIDNLINENDEPINLIDYKKAEQYLIVFWSSTCSHCLEELPKLQKYIKDLDEGKLDVIAIGLDDDIYRWKDKTYEFDSFKHVFGEGKWDNEIGNAYGVTATPTYFLLDKNKRIIAKPYDFDALKKFYKEHPIDKE